MSQSIIVPPVHDTSPPPFDDDVDDSDIIPSLQNNEPLSSGSSDPLNNSNDDWKSIDDNNEAEFAQISNDKPTLNNEAEITENPNATQIVNNWTEMCPTENDNSTVDTESKINEIADDQPIFNNESEIVHSEDDKPINNDTNISFANFDHPAEENFHEENNSESGWANFTTFENQTNENFEAFPTTKSADIEQNNDDDDDDDDGDWANFESNTVPASEPQVQQINPEPTTQVASATTADDEDDDFGEFSEVQVDSTAPPPLVSPPAPTFSTNILTAEQIDSLLSTCFPVESLTSSENENLTCSTELPSFTTYTNPTKRIPCLESSLALWNVLSTISNDPIGIKYQWRKSNTERLFHQALGVNERLRTKPVPLTPEILQPEKAKPTSPSNAASENIDNENKIPNESHRPHFDWKQSGLQNPLADNDSACVASNINKDKNNVFDANKTLDLDFYVPTATKSANDGELLTSLSAIQINDSPIIQSPQQSSQSTPIKTIGLFPGSTTTTPALSDDAKRIIDSFPNLSFMSAKALMFPVRFNANSNEESTSLY